MRARREERAVSGRTGGAGPEDGAAVVAAEREHRGAQRGDLNGERARNLTQNPDRLQVAFPLTVVDHYAHGQALDSTGCLGHLCWDVFVCLPRAARRAFRIDERICKFHTSRTQPRTRRCRL